MAVRVKVDETVPPLLSTQQSLLHAFTDHAAELGHIGLTKKPKLECCEKQRGWWTVEKDAARRVILELDDELHDRRD